MLIIATMFSLSSVAFAATAVTSVNCQPKTSVYGGKSVYFYIKANSKNCKIKFTCGKGELDWVGENLLDYTYFSVYGAYKVKVYKWDKTNGKTTGSCLFEKNIYNKSSYTASFSAVKGSYYRVQVYFWNATTTANSYMNNGIIYHKYLGLTTDFCGVAYYGESNWTKYPSITAKNYSGCTLYKSAP